MGLLIDAAKDLIELTQSPLQQYNKSFFWHMLCKEVFKVAVVLLVIGGMIYLAKAKIISGEVLVPVITMIIGTYLGVQKAK